MRAHKNQAEIIDRNQHARHEGKLIDYITTWTDAAGKHHEHSTGIWGVALGTYDTAILAGATEAQLAKIGADEDGSGDAIMRSHPEPPEDDE